MDQHAGLGGELKLAHLTRKNVQLAKRFLYEAHQCGLVQNSDWSKQRLKRAADDLRGWLLFDRDKVVAFAVLPENKGRKLHLTVPVIDPALDGRGLQCFFQRIQLLMLFMMFGVDRPQPEIWVYFPCGQLPSQRNILRLGFCKAFPEALEESTHSRAFIFAPTLLSLVAADLLPHIGKRLVRVSGARGKLTIAMPATGSPMREGYRDFVAGLAGGKLSLIGLPDIDESRPANP